MLLMIKHTKHYMLMLLMIKHTKHYMLMNAYDEQA
jgi:hypothetical protein